MTKAQWEEVRVQREWGTSIFYEYYKLVKPTNFIDMTEEEFSFWFELYVFNFNVNYTGHQTTVNKEGKTVAFIYPLIRERITNFFNEKFK